MRDAGGMRLGKVGVWRHAVAGASVAGCSVLGFTGLVGQPARPETFEHKQIVVRPEGADGLRIREVVDIDFGTEKRRGYERFVENDFGVPTDVTASSPDAPDDLSVVQIGGETRIRIGDPDVTISGQHRYVLEYTLPDALVSTGLLALDVIGTDETFQTDRFEVVVTGMELDGPLCNTGRAGASGGCTLARDGDVYRAVISPLRPGEGITIGGTITAVTPPVDVAAPDPPARHSDNRAAIGAAMIPLGAVGAGGAYALARRRGRNEVFAGGAAADAFGQLPPPGSAAPQPAVQLVADTQMDELATIEFSPPRGIDPWQAATLLRERVDDETVKAWLSGAVAREGVVLDEEGKKTTLRLGPKVDDMTAVDHERLRTLLGRRDEVRLGTYDAEFGKGWKSLRTQLQSSVDSSGWWRTGGPGATAGLSVGGGLLAVLVLVGWFAGPDTLFRWLFAFARWWPIALVVGLALPALVAWSVYRFLLPARTAVGSALALQSESFRRFLAASEGKHVDWAWEHGLLREYSAWAVALGAADAWSKALQASHVPAEQRSAFTTPLIVHTAGPTLNSTRTAPSSSGGSSGFSGGFSGGSVGGGGGGGRSGSW